MEKEWKSSTRHKSKNLFSKILLFILLLAPIYQDSPLSKYLGAAGYTILMPLSLILTTAYFIIKRKFVQENHIKNFYKLSIWLIISSILGITIWSLLGNPINYVGEFLPVKAVKDVLQYLSYPSYLLLLFICLKKTGEEPFFKYIFIIMIMLLVIGLLEIPQIPYAFENIHFFGAFPYYRMRLLTLEASSTSSLIIIYCGLSIINSLRNHKIIPSFISIICILFFISKTSSKALLISIMIFITIYLIMLVKSKKTKKSLLTLFLVIMLFAIVSVTILPRFTSYLESDIQNFSSTATRSYTIFISLIIGCLFPIGVGSGAHLGVLQKFMIKFINVFEKINLDLNISEILNYANTTTDQALTVKSGIMHYNLYWGIFGTIYLLNTFRKIAKDYSKSNSANKSLFLSLFWTTIILLILSVNFTFEFFILYAYLIFSTEQKGVLQNEQ